MIKENVSFSHTDAQKSLYHEWKMEVSLMKPL